MSYIGNPPAEAYTNTVKDTFSGDGSTTAFTLSRPSLTNNVRVVVENVVQDPTVAYGVSGTTLTFTSAPPSGTNNIYVVHLGPAVQTTVPPDSVTVTDLNAYGDGAAAFTANRASSDGTIIDLQKDGSSVGSVGTNANGNFQLYGAAASHVGLQFGSPSILPVNNSGSSADNAVDLGDSNVRFKDLYLSGGVYLGGTGAANYLDDYEEGTWTPSVTGTSGGSMGLANSQGSYTKVGRVVTLNGYLDVSSAGTASGDASISNFPFTVGDTVGSTSLEANGTVAWFSFSAYVNSVFINAVENTNEARMLGNTSGTQQSIVNLTPGNIGTGNMRFSITYFTN